MDYAEKIIVPSFRSAIRNATTKHEAKALYTGARELIATEVQDTCGPSSSARRGDGYRDAAQDLPA